jgi:hypothetical protein
MSRKGARQIVFVCTNNVAGELVSEIIAASSTEEAAKLFFEQFKVEPKFIQGPFYKKRTRVLESITTLVFLNQTKKAIYNDWYVNAFLTKEPENAAFLVFIKRVDGKVLPPPSGTIVVPLNELRFINVE